MSNFKKENNILLRFKSRNKTDVFFNAWDSQAWLTY